MDRISVAANRLWGSIGEHGQLPGQARFADELAALYNKNLGVLNPGVSKWSYGHQLEHLYRTSHYFLDRLEEAMTGLYSGKLMGPWGCGLMVTGFIPRYWFPTIPQLVPLSGSPEDIEPLRDDLKGRLEHMEWRLSDIKDSRGKSRHPRMKYLTATQWVFFQDVHHRHHLAIIRDIMKGAGH
jgi:hypothetical protein